MARVCEYCQLEQPLDEKELQHGVLIDITNKYDALVGRRLSTLSPIELSIYAKIKQKLQFAIRIAKAQRQKQIQQNAAGNFLMEFGEAMGYSYKWYNVQSAMLKKETNNIYYTDFVLK
jgi:hypothetical protein